jgi:hypothetical protein
MKISPEQIEEWKKLPPQPDKQRTWSAAGRPDASAGAPDGPPNRHGWQRRAAGARPVPPIMLRPPEQPPQPKSEFQKWWRTLGRRAVDEGSQLGQNSPAMQKAIRDLNRSLMASPAAGRSSARR